jgi:hypothetical protein
MASQFILQNPGMTLIRWLLTTNIPSKLKTQKCWTLFIVVRFEAFMAMTMKYAIFWDVTACGSCKN